MHHFFPVDRDRRSGEPGLPVGRPPPAGPDRDSAVPDCLINAGWGIFHRQNSRGKTGEKRSGYGLVAKVPGAQC